MTPRLLLAGLAVAVLSGFAAAPSGAATVYGGGSVPASVNDAVPLFLVTVQNGRGRIVGRSGGACTNGNTALGHFATHPFKLHRKGRFALKGSFAFNIAGGVATGTYRIRGRARPGRGLVSGTASVRLRFPSFATPGKTISCKSGKRAFRARKPGSKPRTQRGPFYGVTSQGLPIVLRPTADASALVPAAVMTTVPCSKLGPMSATPRLRVPAIAPGVYARTSVGSSAFTPALGSPVTVPVGTYDYTTYGFQARIAGGRAGGTITVSSKIGNAQKILIDTCAVPPITFAAIP